MKRALLPVLFLALCTVGLAQSRFTERLTPEERSRAGLDHLTPEQLAALDALVKHDQDSGVQIVRENIRKELREEVKAEVKAEVKQQAKAEAKQEAEDQRAAETRVLSRI